MTETFTGILSYKCFYLPYNRKVMLLKILSFSYLSYNLRRIYNLAHFFETLYVYILKFNMIIYPFCFFVLISTFFYNWNHYLGWLVFGCSFVCSENVRLVFQILSYKITSNFLKFFNPFTNKTICMENRLVFNIFSTACTLCKIRKREK